MTRAAFVEQLLRQVYGGQPSQDANITKGLVNQLLNQGIALAAKQAYNDAIQLDGVGYVNNSFYTVFKNLPIVQDENFLYRITLPEIPIGLGQNLGSATLQFKDEEGSLSLTAYPISENQVGYIDRMRPIPNCIIYYTEGTFAFAKTTYILTNFTVSARMISGGDASNLNSILNVPADYLPVAVEYVKKQLMQERMVIPDIKNDGNDILPKQ